MEVRFQDICGQSIILKLPKNATVSDACQSLSKRIDVSKNIIFLVSQEAKRRHYFYQNGDMINDVLKHNKEYVIFMKCPKVDQKIHRHSNKNLLSKRKISRPIKCASKNILADLRHLTKNQNHFRHYLPIYRHYCQVLNHVPYDFDDKVNQIAQLGYQIEDIKEALRSSFYDVQGAINELVHMNSNSRRNNDDYDDYDFDDDDIGMRRRLIYDLSDFDTSSGLSRYISIHDFLESRRISRNFQRNERQLQQQQQRNDNQRNERLQHQRNENRKQRNDYLRNERLQQQRNERQQQRAEQNQKRNHFQQRDEPRPRPNIPLNDDLDLDIFLDDEEPDYSIQKDTVREWKPPASKSKPPTFELDKRSQPPPPQEFQKIKPQPLPIQINPIPPREQPNQKPKPQPNLLPPPQPQKPPESNPIKVQIDSKVKIELPRHTNKPLFTFDKPKNTPPPPKPQPEQEEEEDPEIQNQKNQKNVSRPHKRYSYRPKLSQID